MDLIALQVLNPLLLSNQVAANLYRIEEIHADNVFLLVHIYDLLINVKVL